MGKTNDNIDWSKIAIYLVQMGNVVGLLRSMMLMHPRFYPGAFRFRISDTSFVIS